MNQLDVMINTLASEYPDYEFAKKALKYEFFDNVKHEVNVNGLEFDEAYDECINHLNAEYQFKLIEDFEPRFNNFIAVLEKLLINQPEQMNNLYENAAFALIDAIEEGYGNEQLDNFQQITEQLQICIDSGQFDDINSFEIEILFQ